MLSDEKIEELWVDIHKGKFMHAGFNTFARAIEAAALPEGWVAVPKEPTLAMLGCLRSDITSNLEKRYQAMLAAAPKPAQAEKQEQGGGITFEEYAKMKPHLYGEVAQAEKQEPVGCPAFGDMDEAAEFVGALGLMECLQDRPVAPSKAVQGKCVVQAEKQEPVKDAPVAWRFSKGTITKLDSCPHGGNWQPLYIHPQPDLTAEVEFMQGKYEEMLEEWLPQKQRIAALEEAAREARDALLKYQQRQSYADLVYAESVGDEALAKLDAVLGDAEITGG